MRVNKADCIEVYTLGTDGYVRTMYQARFYSHYVGAMVELNYYSETPIDAIKYGLAWYNGEV